MCVEDRWAGSATVTTRWTVGDDGPGSVISTVVVVGPDSGNVAVLAAWAAGARAARATMAVAGASARGRRGIQRIRFGRRERSSVRLTPARPVPTRAGWPPHVGRPPGDRVDVRWRTGALPRLLRQRAEGSVSAKRWRRRKR